MSEETLGLFIDLGVGTFSFTLKFGLKLLRVHTRLWLVRRTLVLSNLTHRGWVESWLTSAGRLVVVHTTWLLLHVGLLHAVLLASLRGWLVEVHVGVEASIHHLLHLVELLLVLLVAHHG